MSRRNPRTYRSLSDLTRLMATRSCPGANILSACTTTLRSVNPEQNTTTYYMSKIHRHDGEKEQRETHEGRGVGGRGGKEGGKERGRGEVDQGEME